MQDYLNTLTISITAWWGVSEGLVKWYSYCNHIEAVSTVCISLSVKMKQTQLSKQLFPCGIIITDWLQCEMEYGILRAHAVHITCLPITIPFHILIRSVLSLVQWPPLRNEHLRTLGILIQFVNFFFFLHCVMAAILLAIGWPYYICIFACPISILAPSILM